MTQGRSVARRLHEEPDQHSWIGRRTEGYAHVDFDRLPLARPDRDHTLGFLLERRQTKQRREPLAIGNEMEKQSASEILSGDVQKTCSRLIRVEDDAAPIGGDARDGQPIEEMLPVSPGLVQSLPEVVALQMRTRQSLEQVVACVECVTEDTADAARLRRGSVHASADGAASQLRNLSSPTCG